MIYVGFKWIKKGKRRKKWKGVIVNLLKDVV